MPNGPLYQSRVIDSQTNFMKIGLSTPVAPEAALSLGGVPRQARLWCCLLALAVASLVGSGCNRTEAKK
jgi:hypothetical protein